MSTPSYPQRSPVADRKVNAIVEKLKDGDEEKFQKALVFVVEQYIDIKKAEIAFGKLLAAGLREKDPVILLSALQAYRDRMVPVLGKRDEHISSVLEKRPNEAVAYLVDRMAQNAFTIDASENMFLASHMHRALKDTLREIAEAEIAAYDGNVKEDLRELLGDRAEGSDAAPSAPKP